ncbi:gamma-tubulin complex component GCP6, putative [Talaromyces stipitatus ATCC 10500]|uniref:Spindle pole body component n=1 Tax=Talaromyces stipitatus (strain ATCC 10500 / CBS 375.48 / QM 6759 / NRRL 1006) TaxID=441959 RepID=B8M2D5_TALSN|nr:gamma-tubulin complex component GCP6, putative [Talaromyces stipitatus ATCC 10500]EED21599.1 gamma-tubulin complex component GCP6, putative [Talaromyces stipitatus ATCC 10500]
MDAGDDIEDSFKLKDLWQTSSFALETLPPLESTHFDSALSDIPNGLFSSPLHDFSKNDSILYEINVFGTDDTENLSVELPDVAQSSTDDDNTDINSTSEDQDQDQDNPWNIGSLLEYLHEAPTGGPKLASWDGFLDRHYKEPASAYLSEFGNRGFDAALSHQATVSGLENAGRIIRSSVFLDSLIRLGLGWNSMLFHYNEQKRVFEKSIQDIRITGLSLKALDSMISDISRCGTDVQRIRKFVRANPSITDQPSALSSLASALSVLLYSLEKQLSGHLRVNVSLIQVHNLFQKCGHLVSTLADIATTAEKARSESDVISVLLSKSEDYEQRVPWLANTLHELIRRCTKPWLSLVETWIGLKSEKLLLGQGQSMSNSFVEVEQFRNLTDTALRPATVDYIYHPEFVPSSLPSEQARLLFETGKALRLLKQNQPDHPISRSDIVEAAEAPSLTCAFSWTHIEEIQRRANEYESRLRREITRYNGGDTSRPRAGTRHGEPEHGRKEMYSDDIPDNNFELIDLDDEQHVTGLLASNAQMESDKLYQDTEGNEFFSPQSLIQHDAAFGPPLGSVLYLSLGPTLAVQAKLVDFSCLHLLFKKYKLRYHLTLQWRFQLLGDGTFSSRLSHSLFDPEMSSGERRSGVARGGFHTGLRLGNRDTWPPASSELRLVLMGLLRDCYDAGESELILSARPDAEGKELPGNLSFAIRDLTGSEMIKCKDPNAIEALDFLRMQYKPSTTLESVITPKSLEKYDHLFKYLLRLLRMVSVVNGLIRDSTARTSLSGDTHNIFQEFRIESHHFVNALNDYAFQVAIGMNWHRFESALSAIESCIDRGDIDGTIEIAGSLHKLRKYHEDVLDQILFSLFLVDPKKQSRRSSSLKQVAKLLQEIFGTILAFMPLSKLDGEHGLRSSNEKTVYRLHVTFRKQVGNLVQFLRELDGKRALSTSSSKGGDASRGNAGGMSARGTSSIFEYLLLRLDMKQYY